MYHILNQLVNCVKESFQQSKIIKLFAPEYHGKRGIGIMEINLPLFKNGFESHESQELGWRG